MARRGGWLSALVTGDDSFMKVGTFGVSGLLGRVKVIRGPVIREI